MNKPKFLEQSQLIISLFKKLENHPNFQLEQITEKDLISKGSKLKVDDLGRLALTYGDKLLLKMIVSLSIIIWGKNANLNFIDVSKITDFSYLFSDKYKYLDFKFDKEIFSLILKESLLDEKEIIDLYWMIDDYKRIQVRHEVFDGFINEWDVSLGMDFRGMFYGSEFNQHRLDLNLKEAMFINAMFSNSSYNHPFIVKGELRYLKNAAYLFYDAAIDKEIEIDLSHCDNIEFAFYQNSFSLDEVKGFTVEQLEKVKLPENAPNKIELFVSKELFQDVARYSKLEKQGMEFQSNLSKFLGKFKCKDVLKFLQLENEENYKKLKTLSLLKSWLKFLKSKNIKNIYVETAFLKSLSVILPNYYDDRNRFVEWDEDGKNGGVFTVVDYLNWYENFSDKKTLLNKKKKFIEEHKSFLEEYNLFSSYADFNKNCKDKLIVL